MLFLPFSASVCLSGCRSLCSSYPFLPLSVCQAVFLFTLLTLFCLCLSVRLSFSLLFLPFSASVCLSGSLCLAVTWQFWANDQGLSHADEVTQGWNGYQRMNQHKNLPQENKTLLLLLREIDSVTLWSQVWHSSTHSEHHFTAPSSKLCQI